MTLDWYSGLDARLQDAPDADKPEEGSAPGIWESLEKKVQIVDYQPEKNPHVIEKELSDHTGPYFVLKNTEAKTYLRLSPTEHKLWERMDGQTDVQELIVEHFMDTGEFAHATVTRLVELLYRKQMFTDEPIAVWSQVNQEIAKRSWRYRFSLPAQKFMNQPIGYGGVDKFITWIYKYGGFLFFTRPVQALLFLISILGLLAFSQIIRDPNHTFLGQNLVTSIVLIWLAALLPVFIHELGHALTVKHFGREVPRGGVMLYFGLPAAFVETTDIWLEPKQARLAVTWNGPYTGLIIGGMAAIYIYLVPGAPINSFLFKMLAVAYATVLFNVNPLLKYDGYYLLSDWLEIPSLRERSAAFLRRKFIPKFLTRKKFTRDEIIYTIFGILSFIWIAYALYLISSVYQARIQHSIETLLGRNYSLTSRAFSFLLLAGLVSFAFLMGMRLVGLVQALIDRYSRAGGLQRHGQFALIGSAITVIFGVTFLLALPGQAAWLGPSIGSFAAIFTAYRLFRIAPPYFGSLRGNTFYLFTGALFIAGISMILQLLRFSQDYIFWTQLPAVILVGAGMLLAVFPFKGRVKILPLLLGLISAFAIIAGLTWFTGIPISIGTFSLGIITMLVIWSVSSLLGSARAPAFLLIGLGSIIVNISWLADLPYLDISVIGILLMSAGGLHLVFAQLPQLSSYTIEDIPSETQKAIGTSVAILVRRIIAQVFFETGYLGVKRLGAEFTKSMHQLRVDIQISGNQFQDNELPKRSADELTEVYHTVFDELHHILQGELGRGMANMAFSFGMDLLPWQTREVVNELIISRLDWGTGLGQEVESSRDRRRTWLRRVPLFVTVSDEELDNIASNLKQERFPAGELIIREGEPGDKFYILERGKASVWRFDEDQVERKIDEKGPGQYFGEVALVSSAPRNASVRADTPATTLTLDYSDFNQCVRQYINLANEVDENVKYSWLLRGMPIFDELPSQELDQLATLLEPKTLAAGEILFEEGDQGDRFYIVESGEVIISREIDGEQVEISRREAGEYFGEIALLQNRPRTATVAASIDTRLLSLKAEHFQQLTSHFMQLGATISRTSSRRLSFVEAAGSKSSQIQNA
ncbi:MAG: cyclic nucleotide-binding domain-containing protein [Anaerolineales bacterium]